MRSGDQPTNLYKAYSSRVLAVFLIARPVPKHDMEPTWWDYGGSYVGRQGNSY